MAAIFNANVLLLVSPTLDRGTVTENATSQVTVATRRRKEVLLSNRRGISVIEKCVIHLLARAVSLAMTAFRDIFASVVGDPVAIINKLNSTVA